MPGETAIARIPAPGLPPISIAAGDVAAQRGRVLVAFSGEHLPASRQNAVDDSSTRYAKKSSCGPATKVGAYALSFLVEKTEAGHGGHRTPAMGNRGRLHPLRKLL